MLYCLELNNAQLSDLDNCATLMKTFAICLIQILEAASSLDISIETRYIDHYLYLENLRY